MGLLPARAARPAHHADCRAEDAHRHRRARLPVSVPGPVRAVDTGPRRACGTAGHPGDRGRAVSISADVDAVIADLNARMTASLLILPMQLGPEPLICPAYGERRAEGG